jgi:hypothetical protein
MNESLGCQGRSRSLRISSMEIHDCLQVDLVDFLYECNLSPESYIGEREFGIPKLAQQ